MATKFVQIFRFAFLFLFKNAAYEYINKPYTYHKNSKHRIRQRQNNTGQIDCKTRKINNKNDM